MACRLVEPLADEQPEPTAISAIMIGPPMNSATVNCQPISSAKMMPQLDDQVDAGDLKAIAAVKSAPPQNRARASATAA
jgi:hypothetical protein